MAQYLVLIYEDEASFASAGKEVLDEVMAANMKFGEQNSTSIGGGNALQPTSTATSIRKNASGELQVTDGPFAETKEGLGGYYVIEAEDLDKALEIAKQVPARFGGVEVRPIMVFD
ncbi:MAG: YciI family protein [Acidimicrobiales bacterium]